MLPLPGPTALAQHSNRPDRTKLPAVHVHTRSLAHHARQRICPQPPLYSQQTKNTPLGNTSIRNPSLTRTDLHFRVLSRQTNKSRAPLASAAQGQISERVMSHDVAPRPDRVRRRECPRGLFFYFFRFSPCVCSTDRRNKRPLLLFRGGLFRGRI